MSSKIQNYGVNYYNLKINRGGTIEIDPGDTGQVLIDGDLSVLGTTTTITSQDLAIDDNTIIINNNEIGQGVSQTSAGIIVNRGQLPDVGLFFDESLPFTNNSLTPIEITSGAFILARTDGGDSPSSSTVGLYTGTVNTTNGNDLFFLSDSDSGSKTGPNGPRLTVKQTTDYEERIFPYTGSPGNRTIEFSSSEPDKISRGGRYDDDLIPNIKSVTDYVQAFFSRNYQDKLVSPSPDGWSGDPQDGFSEIVLESSQAGNLFNRIKFFVNNTDPIVTYFEDSLRLIDIRVEENKIISWNNDSDLRLDANGTGQIVFETAVRVEKTQEEPGIPTEGTTIYADDENDGGTGLFFVNENGTRDELISRNRSLLFSIIF